MSRNRNVSCLFLVILISAMELLVLAENNHEFETYTHTSQEVLSRKRRYLIFPEGSSFQLVYDLIVGVVDYTNYLILGVTVALAWELPSKAPSEILDDLHTRLNDGTLGISRNDTATNITYTDIKPTANSTKQQSYIPNYITNRNGYQTNANKYYNYYYKPTFRPPMHSTYYEYYKGQKYPARRKNIYTNYSKATNPFDKWMQKQPYAYTPYTAYRKPAANQYTKYRNYWKQLSTGLPKFGRRKDIYYQSEQKVPRQDKKNYTTSQDYKQNGSARRFDVDAIPTKHKIYPIFGKRSIRDNSTSTQKSGKHHRQRRSGISTTELSKLDRIHIRHHRSTRQDLYEKIEKYLAKHNHDGEACVLRALCETGQKSHESEPSTFVGELMRAIFTLPESLNDEESTFMGNRYDIANAHSGNCHEIYASCKHSLWDAEFIK